MTTTTKTPTATATAPIQVNGAKPHPPTSVSQADFWLLHPAGEYGNTLCFHAAHGERIAYNSAYGWMWRCDEAGHWLHGDIANARIDQAIITTLLERSRRAAQVKNDMIVSKAVCTTRNIGNIKTMVKSFVTMPVEQFDNEPHLLNTKSGVVDLRTGKTVINESGQFTYCVPVEYDPAIDFAPWLNWLDDTIAHHAQDPMRDYLQMATGYSITGYTREECLFFPWGPTRGGKGTYTNTVMAMLGKPLAAAAAFSTFTRKRDGASFDLAPLKAARFVVASEGGKHAPLNEATVKTITGRDMVVCSFKGKDEFSYIPVYKIWLVSNHPVAGDADDDAFWTRIRVISFPNSKAGREDKELKDRMVTPDYLRMVLAYAVRGAQMWWNEPGGLTTPEEIRKTTQAHRDAVDSIGQWLAQNAEAKPGYEISNARLYPNYQIWCEENGFTPKKGKSFAESMQAKGYERATFRDDMERQHRGYRGLDLIDDNP